MTLKKKSFENIVGKGENGSNQHFALFPQCFLPIPKGFSVFKLHLFCHLQMLSVWTSLKFCRNGLTVGSLNDRVGHIEGMFSHDRVGHIEGMFSHDRVGHIEGMVEKCRLPTFSQF